MTLAPATRLGPYEIVAPLGAGGMGEVYRARDTRLGRDVALKVLPEAFARDAERLARLEREARTVAGLNHPNIVVLYSVEEHGGVRFMTMELVEGESLARLVSAGGLPLARVLDLGIALSDALVTAHERGVVHRDLKPANVMLTRDERLKVLDFGLARPAAESPALIASQAATMETPVSTPGYVVGTVPYMAPEQVRGDAVDARTDLFALGVILYELATGMRPFRGTTAADVSSSILRDAPEPVTSLRADLPADFERIVRRCLEKQPRVRFQTALDVLNELKLLKQAGESASAAPGAIRSLAVLPLENLSHDPAQEYFADGMTEALISELARLKALRVISRTSAMKYKGASKALPEIARELSVEAILEGSALLVGKRVRVTLQLVSARADEAVWTERYDGEIADVLDLQSRIAETVAKEIAVQITPREATHLAKRRVVNPEAHVEYLKGRHNSVAGSPQAIELSLRHFQRALELDPTYAPTYAEIAYCHHVRAARGMAPPAEAHAQSREAAMQALALDDSLAEAHTALGVIDVHEMDLPNAMRSLRRAVELNPGLVRAHSNLGHICYYTERHAEAQAEMLKALSLDPLSMITHTSVGDAYYYARDYERSLVYYQKAIELDPRFDGAHTDCARSLEAVGRFDEAQREYEEGRRMGGGIAGPSFGLAHLAASRGNVAEARRMLQELIDARSRRVVSAWGIAALHASLGDVDEAFRWLDTAVAERATGLVLLRVHPRLDPIRSDPRFPALVHRLRLDAV
ncbi:MAG: protein kinase [Candidatus Eisenbacteria bacterium]|nr:protein kinase [Candidatus Eisenbacteria bacterium]